MSRRRLLMLGLLMLLPAANAARGADALLPAIKDLRVGFDGVHKEAFWTPVVVTIHGGSQPASGVVLVDVTDEDGVPTRVSSPPNRPVTIEPGRDTQVKLFVKPGSQSPGFVVRLLTDAGQEFRREFHSGTDLTISEALASVRPLLLTVGAASGIEEPTGSSLPDADRTKVARVNKIEELPTRWYGYDGVDAVVLLTSQPELDRQLTADSAQMAALVQWIERGGMLIMCVGQSAEEVLAPGAPLAELAPGRFEGRLPLRQKTALEVFADTAETLDLGMQNGQPGRLDIPKLVDVQGKIEVYEGSRPTDLPLVIRSPRGFGEIVFVAIDLDRPPLKTWAGRAPFWNRLLGRDKVAPQADENTAQGQVMRLGYEDLAGQLHTGLEQFAGVSVPFSLVAFLILIYIVCIGPLDYFVLKKFFKRMEFTWFTFPAIVLTFSLGAYVLAHALKGEQLRINQVDLVDVDTSSGLVRGTMWSVIFSPRTELFDLSVESRQPGTAAPLKSDVLLSWLGSPGTSSGIGRGSVMSDFTDRAYEFSPNLDRVDGMPISVWSTKGMTARWRANDPGTLVPALRDTGDNMLAGSIKNASPLKLHDAVLVYDRWAYPLGVIEPQGLATLDGSLDPQTVETYFKHMTIVDGRDVAAPYQIESTEVQRIMEILMFHDAAGGRRYTKLSNSYNGYLDAERQLRSGRAVLMARVEGQATQLLRDGTALAGPQDKHWSYFRFVMPVAPAVRPEHREP